MTVLDLNKPCGVITAIGCDTDTHRRLVDMGLLDVRYCVKARRSGASLIAFDDFCAVVRDSLAAQLFVRPQ